MIKEFQGEYQFLSNFYEHEIDYNGAIYSTNEHAFQAEKTLDGQERAIIRESITPGQAKKLGKKVTLRQDWEDIKLQIMLEINQIKFQDPVLKAKLIATNPSILEEGNYWGDKFWGVDLKTGEGENHLGKILMKIRQEIIDEI